MQREIHDLHDHFLGIGMHTILFWDQHRQCQQRIDANILLMKWVQREWELLESGAREVVLLTKLLLYHT